MKLLIVLIFIALLGPEAFSQQAKREIHRGNELYRQQKYAEAEAWYKQSVDKSKESLEGNFNLGDAWYKQKKYEDAISKFTDIAATSPSKGVKAQAYHNLGNALLESNKLEESIDAYKKSLINNPKDEETRYNLAYAQEKLKQQQQQNKDNKDQNKDKQDKDQQNKDNKDKQDKDNKDNKDQDKDQQNKDNKGKDDQDKEQQNEQQPRPDQLSKEDAERMLEAMNQEEKKTQDKLKDKKAKGVKGRIVKQW